MGVPSGGVADALSRTLKDTLPEALKDLRDGACVVDGVTLGVPDPD